MKTRSSQFTQSFAPSPSGSVWREFGDDQKPDRIINVSGELSANYSLVGKPPSRWSSALRDFQKRDLPRSRKPTPSKKRAKKK